MATADSVASQVLAGELSRSRKVSSPSTAASAFSATSTVAVVRPGETVATPRPASKSDPALAVPAAVAQETDTGSVEGRPSRRVNRAVPPSVAVTGATPRGMSESAKARTRPSPRRL